MPVWLNENPWILVVAGGAMLLLISFWDKIPWSSLAALFQSKAPDPAPTPTIPTNPNAHVPEHPMTLENMVEHYQCLLKYCGTNEQAIAALRTLWTFMDPSLPTVKKGEAK